MREWKKPLAASLALLMVLSLVPVSGFAAETEAPAQETSASESAAPAESGSSGTEAAPAATSGTESTESVDAAPVQDSGTDGTDAAPAPSEETGASDAASEPSEEAVVSDEASAPSEEVGGADVAPEAEEATDGEDAASEETSEEAVSEAPTEEASAEGQSESAPAEVEETQTTGTYAADPVQSGVEVNNHTGDLGSGMVQYSEGADLDQYVVEGDNETLTSIAKKMYGSEYAARALAPIQNKGEGMDPNEVLNPGDVIWLPSDLVVQSLPEKDAIVGTKYRNQLESNLQDVIYGWNADGNSFGLSLSDSGEITGTATQTGEFSFMVDVQSPERSFKVPYTILILPFTSDSIEAINNSEFGNPGGWELPDGTPIDDPLSLSISSSEVSKYQFKSEGEHEKFTQATITKVTATDTEGHTKVLELGKDYKYWKGSNIIQLLHNPLGEAGEFNLTQYFDDGTETVVRIVFEDDGVVPAEPNGGARVVVTPSSSSNGKQSAPMAAVYLSTPVVTDSEEAKDTEDTDAECDTYEVQPGDCLWSIAEKLFNDGFKWVDIYELNKDTIKDPDVIYVGQILKVPASEDEEDAEADGESDTDDSKEPASAIVSSADDSSGNS